MISEMKVIVVGDGKVGYTLTEQLSREGHDVVVIDNNAAALTDSMNMLDVMGVVGNGATYTAQKEAGVEQADIRLYPLCRHELLNEINREEVYGHILDWMRVQEFID
jgi:anaerobic glycerol-3-phosphate dehydrogenase